jgi:predicted component of type VI protein secretion system
MELRVQAKLVVVMGEGPADHFQLELPAIIGRSRSTDVKLEHPLISRHHCEVYEADGVMMLRDLGSLNGTFVDGTRLTEQAMPIEPGGEFSVGPVTFRAEYQEHDRTRHGDWHPESPHLDPSLAGEDPLRTSLAGGPLTGNGRDEIRNTPAPPNRPPRLPHDRDSDRGPSR